MSEDLYHLIFMQTKKDRELLREAAEQQGIRIEQFIENAVAVAVRLHFKEWKDEKLVAGK